MNELKSMKLNRLGIWPAIPSGGVDSGVGRMGGRRPPPQTGRVRCVGYSSSWEELQSTPSPPEPPKLGVMGVEGLVDGGAGAGFGEGGLGAARRPGVVFFLGGAFLLGAVPRFAAFFLRAGRRAAFLCSL